MKRLLLLPIALVLIAVTLVFWFRSNTKSVSSDKNFKDFLIVKGSGASQIGNKLYDEDLIKNPLVFKIYIQISGQAGKIQAGEYRLSPSLSLFEVVTQLLRGPAEIWITIPEGLRREEVAERFSKALGKDEVFTKEFLSSSSDEEGYLFPDTYLFPKTASASAIVNKMTNTFDSRTSKMNLTRDRVILASLVERETKTSQERPIVAGILLNRIEIGMALQVDATLQYVNGTWGLINSSDKKTNSPYNTYKFPGLPPGPIASPGLSSLEAVVNPSDSDYLYYLHNSKGQIYYAKTLAEHNENIRRYLTD
ncbi:MAG: endolytic transglycosylase MltG [Patescibacteria group bacterium]